VLALPPPVSYVYVYYMLKWFGHMFELNAQEGDEKTRIGCNLQ